MPSTLHNELLTLTDQCVKCGLCLPSCPTYNLYLNEAESPRGRITLIQGLVRGQIDATDKALLKHLDHCLGCGNCDSVCPSGVKFNLTLDQAKSLYPLTRMPAWLLAFFTRKKLFASAARLSRLVPRWLAAVVPGLPGRMLAFKPFSAKRISCNEPPATRQQPHPVKHNIAIFTGCIGQVSDAAAISQTCKLLAQLGHHVVIPAEQGCCGAMHLHEGHADKARSLMQHNLQVFNAQDFDVIVYFASGCGCQLLGYKDQSGQQLFKARLMEVTGYLASQVLNGSSVNIEEQVIAIHSPCTLTNKTGAWPVMLETVRELAGDRLVELAGNDTCCGSAGLHMLKYPQAADQLVTPKIASLIEINADILLTSNTGCALHFQQAINKAGLATRVMHPAEWIAEQLLVDD